MTAAEREAELRKREVLRDQHKLIYRALYSAGEGTLPAPRSLMSVLGIPLRTLGLTAAHLPCQCLRDSVSLESLGSNIKMQPLA